MKIHMQRQTTAMPYLLKDKQCIQQITRPRMGKKMQAGVQHLLYQLFIVVKTSYRSYGKGQIMHLSSTETTVPINTKF